MLRYFTKFSAVTSTTFLLGMLFNGCSVMAETQNTANAARTSNVQTAPVPTVKSEETELHSAKTWYEKMSYIEAFQIFKRYAESGNTEAEFQLARCYAQGAGTPKNVKKAFEFFQRAASKNDPRGITGLGTCYENGLGTAVNLQTAKDCYLKAANMNHPGAILKMAILYGNNTNEYFNPKEAEKYFKKAVELNAAEAKACYAVFLLFQKRYAETVQMAQASIESPSSMRIMAQCYENGWGVPLNIHRAVEFAETQFMSYEPTEWSANVCYHAGLEEKAKNGMTDLAKRYFKCASDQGHAASQFLYGVYLFENGSKSDALTYIRNAADKGNVFAMIKAAEILREQKKEKDAIPYLLKATCDPRTLENAIAQISSYYHINLNEHKSGLFWDHKGLSMGIALCRNVIAMDEIQKNGDEHFTKAAALFAESDLKGNTFAETWMNDILKKDYERLRILADKGNSDALLTLGIVGLLEEKSHPNIAIGLELLEKAANLKNARACCLLGDIHRIGNLVKEDLKKALEWYQKGAELGDAESAKTVALMLFYEDEFKKTKLDDYKKAFDRCMENDDYDVAYEYGNVMENTAKDLKRAEELYRIAAAHKDPRAMLHLHDLLIKNNADESFSFLWEAVDLEYWKAELRMGDIQKVWEQPRNSFIHYLKAYLHGDSTKAMYRIAECWLNGYGCEVNYNCFWNMANKAYEKGNVEVCYLIGSVYRDGKICHKDTRKAKAYFEAGVKRGSEQCKNALNDF